MTFAESGKGPGGGDRPAMAQHHLHPHRGAQLRPSRTPHPHRAGSSAAQFAAGSHRGGVDLLAKHLIWGWWNPSPAAVGCRDSKASGFPLRCDKMLLNVSMFRDQKASNLQRSCLSNFLCVSGPPNVSRELAHFCSFCAAFPGFFFTGQYPFPSRWGGGRLLFHKPTHSFPLKDERAM